MAKRQHEAEDTEREIQLREEASTQPAEKSVAEKIAEYIGASIGELTKKKQDLETQLAEVNRQLASVGSYISNQIKQYLPSSPEPPAAVPAKRPGRPPGSRGPTKTTKQRGRKKGSKVSTETRQKMKDSWARRKAEAASKKQAEESAS